MNSIDQIVIYKGTVTLTAEFHSGAFDGNPATDHPLVRDVDGSVILRGESLAGLIRQELVRYFNYKCLDYKQPEKRNDCNCEVCRLMGNSNIPDEEDRVPGRLYRDSRAKVSGSAFQSKGVRVRHSVAIGRPFQVAVARRKYDREILLAGAIANFRIELESPTDEETTAVEHVLQEMQSGFISLGGRKGAGFGGFTVAVKRHNYNMGDKDGVSRYLLRRDALTPVDVSANISNDKSSFRSIVASGRGARLMLTFDLWFPELFLVNDPLEAALVGSDHVSVTDGEGNPWLPPSSMRGVFRNRSEQILRTLNSLSACDPTEDKDKLPLLSCSTGIEHKRRDEHKDDSWPTWQMLEQDDFLCLACQLFGTTHLKGRIRFQPGTFVKSKQHLEMLQHFLAIDRFAGGGKEGAKYDAYPLYDVKFADCRLILEDFSPWQAGLLALTFKDLYQGDMRFGFGTRKGFGLAIAKLNDNTEMRLSKSNGLYCIKVGQSDENDKKDLESTVAAFRKRAGEFKGVTYVNKETG